jgi:hypothetical protein
MPTIDVVRGRLSAATGEQLVRFWTVHGLLDEATARARLPEVVCVATGGDGEVVGVNTVFAERVPLIGGRRFWMYNSALLASAAGAAPELLRTAFRALDAAYVPDGDEPVGLCLLVGDREELRRRPEAEWTDPRLVYAGYLPDGRQVRIGYFAGATIGPGA